MNRIAQSIDVNVPIGTAYNQWTRFEEFPRFMEGVREVRQLDPAHLHWRAARNGMEMEWDSEITDQVADHHIAWRDTSGPKNAGSIRFQSLQSDRTRIELTIERDPAGIAADGGQAAPALSQRVGQDLARFKKLIESESLQLGGWRGEIHAGRTVRADMPESADATSNPLQKTVAQTEAEREDAAQSTSRHADADAAERSQARQSGADAAANDGRGRGAAPGSGGPQWLPHILHRWEEPKVMVKKMTQEMDQLFDRFIGRPMASRLGQAASAGKWIPPVEVAQRDDQLIICIDLPGVKIEDVLIEIDRDMLTIEGERRESGRRTQVPGFRRSERCYGRFHRMIPLPAGVDADAAQASMRDGVLEVVMPMPASSGRRGRRIDIQAPPY